jgi:hypothetical protein
MSNNTDSTAIDASIFDAVKECLIENERLFTKLRATGMQYESIDFDESGLYEEEEQTVLRHCNTLSNKIIQSLNETVEACTFKRIAQQTPNDYLLSFEICNDDITYQIHVNYKDEEALIIT